MEQHVNLVSFDTKLERLHKWSIETDTSDHTGRTLLRQVFDSFKEATESYHLIFKMLSELV